MTGRLVLLERALGTSTNIETYVAEKLKGGLDFSIAPENNPRIISKTVDVSLYKEGNSFGFVLRGQCDSLSWSRDDKNKVIEKPCMFSVTLM